jgi:hypothetical protein
MEGALLNWHTCWKFSLVSFLVIERNISGAGSASVIGQKYKICRVCQIDLISVSVEKSCFVSKSDTLENV